MARITCDFFSEVLMLNTSMTVLLPEQMTNQTGMQNNKRLHPTLYLLHGFSDDHTVWSRRTAIERYIAELGLAVVMPNMDHSFYTNMNYGRNYWTFLTEELPSVSRGFFPLSDRREDNFVAGLSMGGYGALKWALSKPEDFAAVASLSGVLDIVSHLKQNENPMHDVLYRVFGEQNLSNTSHDLFYLINGLNQSDRPKPKVYQACGTEDFLYQGNVAFKKICDNSKLDILTTFDQGSHEWSYWDRHIQHVLDWLPL